MPSRKTTVLPSPWRSSTIWNWRWDPANTCSHERSSPPMPKGTPQAPFSSSPSSTTRLRNSPRPYRLQVECSDDMPMDDATASDNCGEVTIDVSSETTAGDVAGNYVIVRTFTATDDAGNSSRPPDHHRPGHHRLSSPFPADYTLSARTRCHGRCHGVGQLRRGDDVVVQRDDRGDAAGNYVIVRTFTATDDAGNSSSATQTITLQDTTAPEFTFVPAETTVECSDEMPMDDGTASDNCGEVTIEVQRNDRWRCGRQLRDRSHLHGHRRRWKQQSATQTITVQDTTHLSSPSSLPKPPLSARTRCRWTTPRRPTTAAR